MHRTFLGEFASVAVIAFATLAVLGGGAWIVASLIAITVVGLALYEARTDAPTPRRGIIAGTVLAAVLAAVWHPAFVVALATGAALLAVTPRPARGEARMPAHGRRVGLTSEHMFAKVVASTRSDASRAEGGFLDDDAVLPTKRDRVLAPPLEPRV